MSDHGPGGHRHVRRVDLEDRLRDLVDAAKQARKRAHAPYSHYRVGAAVLTGEGIVPGCNVEISSYSLTLCAERVALFAAVAAGRTDIRAIAVAGPDDDDEPTPPCGACRQVIWDLAGDIPVLLVGADGDVEIWSAAGLLPVPFGPQQLDPRS